MKCLILASGFGIRLRSEDVSKAKGLLEYKGKSLIGHIVDKIPENVEIFVNTNKVFEVDFRRWQQTLSRRVTLCVEPVFSADEAFGAVGSLNYWIKAKEIKDDLLVIASDNYFEFDLLKFMTAYNRKNTLVAVYDVGDKDKARQFGVVQLDKHKIIGLEEKPKEPRSSIIAIACYLFPPHTFSVLSEFCTGQKRDNLGHFMTYLADREEVYAHTFSELWFDIGSTGVYRSIQQGFELT